MARSEFSKRIGNRFRNRNKSYTSRQVCPNFCSNLTTPKRRLLVNNILRQFGDIKVHYGKLNEKHDERTITIPPQQETHIMLQQDVSITSLRYSRCINQTEHKCKHIWKSMGSSSICDVFQKKGVS